MDGETGVLWVANLLAVGADHELIVRKSGAACSSFLSDRSYFLNGLLEKSYVRPPST